MMIKQLKNSFPLIVLGVIMALGVVMLPPAIKFFFRGFLLLLENPLEGLAFFVFLTLFISVGIYFDGKDTKKEWK